MAGRRVARTLTAAFVRSTKEPGKYFDGQGLYLRVDPSGGRSWVQRIVIRGRRCELGLGSPVLVSLAEAREKALANRKLAREGGDPLQAKRAVAAIMTFEEAARELHRQSLPSWRSAKYGAQFLRTLEDYAFPRLGRLRVREITTADILALLTPIWFTKGVTAKRVLQRIGMVMKWSKAQGWRTDNPAEDVIRALPRQSAIPTPRRALPYAEVAKCLAAVKACGVGPSTKLVIEFIALTATRSREAREAVWQEIDLDSATWTIAAERMKGARTHRIPLSSRALAVLGEARLLTDGKGYVFPGNRRGRQLADGGLVALIKELGFNADVHGFRTSFRTWAQDETDFPREVAEFALAHVVGDAAERAYARSDLFEKRRTMMDAWAAYLELEAQSRGGHE